MTSTTSQNTPGQLKILAEQIHGGASSSLQETHATRSVVLTPLLIIHGVSDTVICTEDRRRSPKVEQIQI